MNSGGSGSSEAPQNQGLNFSQSHLPHVADANNRPSSFRTENVWLSAVSDIIKHESVTAAESMQQGFHHPAELQNQNVPFQSKQSDFHIGTGGNVGRSIKAFSHPSAFESSELGKKRTRRNLVTEENSLDDILSQITSKLTNLCTVTTEGHGSDVTANFNPEESIQAFIDVLKCPHMEASFYLESSDWNIETAVLLWLENNPNPINLRSYSKEYSSSAYNPHVVGDSNSSSNNGHLNLGDFSHSDNIFAHRRFGGYADEDDEYEFKRTAGQVNADGLMYPQRRRSAWIRTSGISRRWRPRTVEIAGLDPEWSARVSRTTGRIIFKHISTGKEQSIVPAGFADPVTEDSQSSTAEQDMDQTGDCEAMEKEAGPVDPETDLSAINDEGLHASIAPSCARPMNNILTDIGRPVDYSASLLPTSGNHALKSANQTGFDMDIPSGDINMMESRSSSAIDSFTFHSGFAAAPGITEGGDKASEEEQRPAERR